MLEAQSDVLADRLAGLLQQSRFRMTPGLLGKLSGLPKATLVNWLEGRVTRPRRWQDVVRVADALRLPEESASELLASAGHPTVRELLALQHAPDDERLLEMWATHGAPRAGAWRALPNPGPLYGRHGVAGEIGALLTESGRRLVTIAGMPGVGKTHLAIHVARSLRAHFSCEPVWIPLGAVVGATRIVGAVASALGQSAQNEATLTRFLAREFSERSVLFVIDNAEHLVDAAAAVTRLIECAPGISILLTSRSPLHCAGEAEVRVAPLPVPGLVESSDPRALGRNPAVLAFCAHADGLDVRRLCDDDLVAIGTIVRRLEGIPLAIALAAARVPFFALGALARNVAERFSALSNPEPGVDGRRQTLRSAIDWSYELLSSEQRTFFRRCALFENGWTLESTVAVATADADRDVGRAFANATSLVEHGLVLAESDARGEPRFRMLDTMRDYALERFDASNDRSETERTFVRYYSDLIGAASRACAIDASAWPSDLFRIEAPNVGAALDLALGSKNAHAALTMATAWSIWETQSDLERGLERTRGALRIARDVVDPDIDRLRAQALRTLGIFAIERRQLGEAAAALETALELTIASDDVRGTAIARSDLAFLAYRQKRSGACAAYANAALEYFRELVPEAHRELGWVNAYLALASADDASGWVESNAYCAAALDHASRGKDKRLRAFVHHLQGVLAVRSSDVARAEREFMTAIGEFGDRETSISFNALAGLGVVAAERNEDRRAILLFAVAERGLAGVRDFGMALHELDELVLAARERIVRKIGADSVEAWSRETSTESLRSALRDGGAHGA